jgi:hypothetical protein
MLDEAGSASYELSEEEYARNEVEDTWVQALLAMLCAILQWLQPFLTPNNYDALVASLLEKVRLLLWPLVCWRSVISCHTHMDMLCHTAKAVSVFLATVTLHTVYAREALPLACLASLTVRCLVSLIQSHSAPHSPVLWRVLMGRQVHLGSTAGCTSRHVLVVFLCQEVLEPARLID